MNIGLQINRFTWKGEPDTIRDTLEEIARTADDAGFYSIWVMDHFFQIGYIGEPEEPMLEAYTTLGFLAGVTKKAKLGTMVTGVIYRNPALLVKIITTLDVLSRGRAYLGIGAAWNEEESQALGFDFPPLKDRFEQLEEALKIAQQMWKGDEKPFDGKHYHLDRPLNSPNQISKPHPPILIGGGGEKKTLRLVAKYADACNLFLRLGEEENKRKLDILRQHCEEVGRNYDEIEKTALYQVGEDMNPEKVIDDLKNAKELGYTHVIVGIRNVEDITPLKVLGEKVIPQVSKF
ncbi:MAG TPA: LLM class F420-dependent oxidoreductase [Candidatus Saccharimonadales bacterium]|nr:LLM class F420-dependent oxidoreductase [Candidatus Saccharimonadales bacterium]